MYYQIYLGGEITRPTGDGRDWAKTLQAWHILPEKEVPGELHLQSNSEPAQYREGLGKEK